MERIAAKAAMLHVRMILQHIAEGRAVAENASLGYVAAGVLLACEVQLTPRSPSPIPPDAIARADQGMAA